MKGQLYTVMMTLFIIPILALIIFYSHTTIPKNIDTSIRAEELQYLSESISEDLMRFLQINGKRALIAAVSMVVTNGKGLDNAPASLAEMIENGTLDGTQPFVDEKNLTVWEKNISDIATTQGFKVNFINALPINVTQSDSFSVLFNATIYVNISDDTAGMYVLKNLSVAAAVSIEGIEDPLYATKTFWNVSVPIKRSPFNKYSNISNLTLDIINGYYHSSNKSASFLDRLEGKVTLSYQPYGLESFIYLPKLINNYQSNTLSVLDWQYWTNTHGYLLNNSYQSYNPAVYSWFRMYTLTEDDYGLNSTLNKTT